MTLKQWIEYVSLTVFAAILRIVPRGLALWLGSCIGWLGWSLRIRRDVVLANLEQAIPELTAGDRVDLGAKAARNFGRTCAEFMRFAGRDRARLGELVAFHGTEELRAALDEGRGVVIVTGHLGAWAVYVAAMAHAGLPTALLVGRQHNRKVDEFILSLPGDRVIFVSQGPTSPRHLLQNLKKGNAVVMVADQHGGPRGTMAPFLGRDASTLSLPGALVARQKVPLFVMAGHRVNGARHELSFRRVLVNHDENRDEEWMRTHIATVCNKAIGDAVLEHPDQYFWYHRRYRVIGETGNATPS